MAVVAVFQGPTLTKETYEASVRELTGGRARVEKPSDWPVNGLLVHVAGETANGFRVVDVWESEEAFGKFGEALAPVMAKLGIKERPEVYSIHSLVSAGATV
jgi:hypothetical protein